MVALLFILVHLVFMKQRSADKIVEIVLMYLLAISVGAGALVAGVMHVFNGPATATMIGWPAGSPFQYEVGVADIAFGTLAFLCLFLRGNFWLAAIIANSIFLLGCMIGHVNSLLKSGNQAAYNIGPNIIFADLLMPLVMIGLYFAYVILRRQK